jgi:hypothetical protein
MRHTNARGPLTLAGSFTATMQHVRTQTLPTGNNAGEAHVKQTVFHDTR